MVRGVLAAALALTAGAALAQTDSARPARGPASETAVPNAAPPATTHRFLRLNPLGIPHRGFQAIGSASPSQDVMIISFLSKG